MSSLIFVSYSRNDGSFTRRLVKDIRLLGLQVWIDIDDIKPGIPWDPQVEEALNTCTVMLLVVSPDAIKSPNVANEWKHFLSQGKVIIPIIYEPTKLSYELERIQHIDFYAESYVDAFIKLRLALNNFGLLTLSPGKLSIEKSALLKATRVPPDGVSHDDNSTPSQALRMKTMLERYIEMRRSGKYTFEEIARVFEIEFERASRHERDEFIALATRWEENQTDYVSSQAPAHSTKDYVLCPACSVPNQRSARFCNNCGKQMDERTPTELIRLDTLNGVARCTLILTVMGQSIQVDFNNVVVLGRSSHQRQIYYVKDKASGEEICVVNLTAYNADKHGVSRQHASLTLVGRTLRIQDLNSTNNSYLGTQLIAPDASQMLINGDVIRLSTLELRVNFRFNF